jgi:DNA-directed RNA polymerase subunit RPC12/RpoP
MDEDRARYNVWTLPNWILLHFVLNPVLAINELLLGQRVPAVILIDKHCEKPWTERQYARCPDCGELNDAWAYQTSVGNYAGLACRACGAKIPTLTNALSWVILRFTWPLWRPLERRYGPALLARQLERGLQRTLGSRGAPPSGLKMGLIFGVFMAVFFIGQQLFMGMPPAAAVIGGLLGGVAAGAVFGAIMKLVMARRGGTGQAEPPRS